MRVIGIDPGYAKAGKGCACAFYDSTQGKVVLWFERPPNMLCRLHFIYGTRLSYVVWEVPQMDGRTWSVPPDVVIRLASDGATLASLYACHDGRNCEIEAVTPSNSKGSVRKPIAHDRLLTRLTAWELAGVKRFIPDVVERVDAAVELGAQDRWRKSGGLYYPRTWLGHNLLDALDLAHSRAHR